MKTTNAQEISQIVFKAVAMAMGVAVIVLNILGSAEPDTLFFLLGVGLFALGLSALNQDNNGQ
jgi:hypothetical protein